MIQAWGACDPNSNLGGPTKYAKFKFFCLIYNMLDSSRRIDFRRKVDELRERSGFRTIDLVYKPSRNVLYSDLNETLTLNDLKYPFFESLGILQKAERIFEEDMVSYTEKIEKCAALLECVPERKVYEASVHAAENADVNEDLTELIEDSNLDGFVIFSGLPQQTVNQFVNRHMTDIYPATAVSLYAYGTKLERDGVRHNGRLVLNGNLTGRAEKVFNDHVREHMIKKGLVTPPSWV